MPKTLRARPDDPVAPGDASETAGRGSPKICDITEDRDVSHPRPSSAADAGAGDGDGAGGVGARATVSGVGGGKRSRSDRPLMDDFRISIGPSRSQECTAAGDRSASAGDAPEPTPCAGRDSKKVANERTGPTKMDLDERGSGGVQVRGPQTVKARDVSPTKQWREARATVACGQRSDGRGEISPKFKRARDVYVFLLLKLCSGRLAGAPPGESVSSRGARRTVQDHAPGVLIR